MIESVVFDLGNTVFKFVPNEIIKKFNNGKYNANIDKILFKNWYRFDNGELTKEKFFEVYGKYFNPKEIKVVNDILNNWISELEYNEHVIEVAQKIKQLNVRLFILSNIPIEFAKVYKKIEQLQIFDDALFSSQVNLLKPDKKIFIKAIKKFRINPTKTIYLDDLQINVDASIECGFIGKLYVNNIDEIYELVKGENYGF